MAGCLITEFSLIPVALPPRREQRWAVLVRKFDADSKVQTVEATFEFAADEIFRRMPCAAISATVAKYEYMPRSTRADTSQPVRITW